MSYTTFRNEANINKNNLDRRYSNHFQGDTIIDKISLELCKGSFFSKKEYCESIEVVRVIQRFIKSSQQIHIYDICGGHGFVGILLALLSKGVKQASIIDLKRPLSYDRLLQSISKDFPQVKNKVDFIQKDYKEIIYKPDSLLIGIHACGNRSDAVLNTAYQNNCGAIILPCCYKKNCLPGYLNKFSDVYELKNLVDIHRITIGYNNGYNVYSKAIPLKVTPMNRLFIFVPEKAKKPNSEV